MILNLHNSSSEIIKVYFYNLNQKIIINAFEKRTFAIDDEVIQLEVSSNANSFSKINVMFAAIGIAIGGYFGAKYGIICYLVIFTLYFIIIYLIDLHNDKHLSVDRSITHDYISTLFS